MPTTEVAAALVLLKLRGVTDLDQLIPVTDDNWTVQWRPVRELRKATRVLLAFSSAGFSSDETYRLINQTFDLLDR